jgi:hypothetical protein
VTIKGDLTLESLKETFTLNLSSPAGATIDDAQGVGTITDDEARLAVTGKSLTATKPGKSFTGVVATFTSADFNTASSFKAEILWGDGAKTVGTIAFNATSKLWEVSGAHTYSKGGTFAMKVTVIDANAFAATGSGTMKV